MLADNIRGMQTFDQHLVDLYLARQISMEDALAMATSSHEFRLMLTQKKGEVQISSEKEPERLLNRRRSY